MKSIVPKILVIGTLLWCLSARAADPQPYTVELVSVGNDDMDQTLKATSDLLSLRSSAPVSPFGLIARARSDSDRLKTALESFGYYESRVTIVINGLPLTDPSLGDALSALPSGSTARVAVSFTLGTLYHLRRIDIDGEMPKSIDAHNILGLATGQPAVAATVLAGGSRLLSALQEQGYAFAKVDPPIAYQAADAPVLDLSFHVEAGGKVNIGRIRIEGLKRVHESLLRKRLLLHTGDQYKPSAIEAARRDLLGMSVFGQVSVEVGSKTDELGGVPVTFTLRERPRHAITLSAAYSSDLGGSGGAAWTDRNVFGNAEQLSFAASVINLGGSDTTGTGYDTSVKYLIPDFLHRDQSLQFAVGAIKQQLQAYDQTARTASVTLSRKLSSIWSVSAGLSTTDEQITQITSVVTNDAGQLQGVPQIFNYTLVALPLNINYDSTDLATPLEDPRHGFRGSLSVTPTLAIGHPNATFLISVLKVATYFDLNNLLPTSAGRSVLAARALVGAAQGAGELSLPPDQRFYAGGTSTIRGYGYQLVGPMFPQTDIPIGGTAIAAVGLEFRQRLYTSWGIAAFVDAGQVSASIKPAPDDTRVGAGAGMRYYTPIGPIRFDIAVPVRRRAGEDSFEVYIGLGQAF
ncbi:MAG TPA: BamA/TamA family outer membrane protein [Steroidobacteraceae bacterium]|jgi:translocation and assembly module TamA|nr:BamA/TamA family outer membrane protein [Steroidobacteraceae bacterium]